MACMAAYNRLQKYAILINLFLLIIIVNCCKSDWIQQQYYVSYNIVNRMLHLKSKRYSCQQLDFIVPFLINQVESPEKSYQLQRKRYSVPDPAPENRFIKGSEINEMQTMQKVYGLQKKYIKDYSLKKSRSKLYGTPTVDLKKVQSFRLDQQSFNKRNRIFKVHSHVNYVPTEIISPLKYQQSQFKGSNDESPILGIKFKKKSVYNIESSKIMSQDITAHKSQYSQRQQRKYVRYFKQKKEWDKKRSKNVDLIINNQCRTFIELMSQYKRRMSLEDKSRIFIFDSKDVWMKRVLVAQGWQENTNKDSKAFDLLWTHKPYKHRVYVQQKLNHYLNSDLVTSKIGLHRLLSIYGLSKLQPLTFDLSSQQSQFLQQFARVQFISKVKKLLFLFQFQDAAKSHSLSRLKQLICQLVSTSQGSEGRVRIELLAVEVLKWCLILLDCRAVPQYNTKIFDDLEEAIQATSVFPSDLQAIFRALRDFQLFYSQSRQLQSYTTIGYENVWIIKNKTSSKGIGISLHNSCSSIIKQQNKLAQKYIERPLLFKQEPFNNRKFDIRLWVLVVGSKNPKLYYHQQFYGRICYSSYSLAEDTLKNEAIHLSNYSLNKGKFADSNSSCQSILCPAQLFEAVNASLGINYVQKFYEDVQSLLRKLWVIFVNEIVVGSTEGSFELFGFDLLIDSVLHLHLLEANLSARCEQRHPALTDMLESMAKGIMNILKFNSDCDLHGWRLIQSKLANGQSLY